MKIKHYINRYLIHIILFYSLFMLSSCKSNSQDCLLDYKQFDSYEEVKDYVADNYSCKSKNPSSSWINKLTYCKCDGGGKGYLIMTTNTKKYIHKPISEQIWKELISVDDVDQYYNERIKGKYRIRKSELK